MSALTLPAVSVIIPCYKVTGFIADALDSLRRQTFRDFETILVNDGCPDTVNLERVLEPYRGEITYLKQHNLGRSGARNTGIRAARAPILAFLDGDDIWEPDYLEYQFGFLVTNPEVDLVYPNAMFFGPGIDKRGHRDKHAGQARLYFMDVFPSEGEVTIESLVNRRCHVLSSLMARRQIITRAGGFDVDLRACEDLDLWIRVAKSGGQFAFHRKPLYRYRVHGEGATSDSLFMQTNLVAVLEKQIASSDPLAAERQLFQDELYKQRRFLDFLLGRRELYAGNSEGALEYLNRAGKVVEGRKISLTIIAARVAPRLLHRYIRHRYPNEKTFVS